MNFFAISSLAALALITGCAASTDEASEASEDELTSRPAIQLETTQDPKSVQAKLANLMDAFKGDADLGIQASGRPGFDFTKLQMTGAPEAGVRGRAITCNSSSIEAVGPGGTGFTRIAMFDCLLQGFNKVRNGGKLPFVVVPFDGNKPLAGKLFTLLAQGNEKGGLGVTRTGGERPPCCDIPSTVTYSIADDDASLSCTMRSGGFAAIQRVECTFVRNDTHN